MSRELESSEDPKNEQEQIAARPASEAPGLRGIGCPQLSEWGLYEAELLSNSRSIELTDHASICDACGALLADLHSGDLPKEAVSDVELKLRSGTTEWKREMLRQITGQIGSRAVIRRRPYLWWIASAAAILTGAFGVWRLNQGDTPEVAFRLLAQSYSEERPFVYRIPDATPGGTQSRGTGEEPTALKKAVALTADRKQEGRERVAWLRADALGQLLSGKSDLAIATLENLRGEAPNDADVLGSLAIAHLVRADRAEDNNKIKADAKTYPPSSETSRPDESPLRDRALAVELLATATGVRMNDPVLLFNWALAMEKMMPGTQEAVDAWDKFLNLRTSDSWTEEANRHKSTQEGLRKRNGKASTPGRPEDSIQALALQGFRSGATPDPAVIARKLRDEHRDPWMSDFLAAYYRTLPKLTQLLPKIPREGDGKGMMNPVELLAKVSRDTASGEDYANADRQWATFESAFRATNNQAGITLALLERAYVLNRISKSDECLANADVALPLARELGYRWIEAQLRLEMGTCYGLRGWFGLKYDAIRDSERIAQDFGYTTTAQRGRGFQASALRQLGAYRESLDIDGEGVRRYLVGEGTADRAYQFYYGLASAASSLDYPHAAAEFAREAASLAPNRPVEAIIRASYAEMLVQAGHLADADREFRLSADIFQSLQNSSSVQLYKARAEIAVAQIQGQEGRVAEGLIRLTAMEGELPRIKNAVVAGKLWHAKADLLIRAGQLSESNQALLRILDLNKSDPTAAVKANAPTALAHEVSDAVRILVDRELEHQLRADSSEADGGARALADWNQYFPSFRTMSKQEALAPRLIYADLPSGPVVWLLTDQRVRFSRLPISGDRLRQSAMGFRRMLGDKDTRPADIRAAGRELYSQLIGPIERWIGDARTIYISADGPFANIPFGPLVAADGHWLADRYNLVYSPPLRGVKTMNRADIPKSARFLGVSSGQAASVFWFTLPALLDLDQDLQPAAAAFANHTLLSGSGATRDALLRSLDQTEVFHFSGHAVVTAVDAALVLAGSSQGDESGRLLWSSELSAHPLSNTRLAVLAACSTSRVAGEDADPTAGLARAFLLAGVPQVIASRWDVDSRATSVLLEHFYASLKSGVPVEEALARAIRSVKDQASFAQPYYWAAFDLLRS